MNEIKNLEAKITAVDQKAEASTFVDPYKIDTWCHGNQFYGNFYQF